MLNASLVAPTTRCFVLCSSSACASMQSLSCLCFCLLAVLHICGCYPYLGPIAVQQCVAAARKDAAYMHRYIPQLLQSWHMFAWMVCQLLIEVYVVWYHTSRHYVNEFVKFD